MGTHVHIMYVLACRDTKFKLNIRKNKCVMFPDVAISKVRAVPGPKLPG